MSHDRRPARVAAHAIFQLTVGTREAIVLPHVFLPRRHDECLQVTVGSLEILGNPPTGRAVAQPDASVFAHRFEELRFAAGGNLVFDCNQYPTIGIGFNGRESPVVPRCQIGTDIGDTYAQR